MARMESSAWDVLHLESLPKYWDVEESGEKSNTIRIRTCEDIVANDIHIAHGKMRMAGKDIKRVEIVNTSTKELFVRTLTDVSVYENVIIYSWSSLE